MPRKNPAPQRPEDRLAAYQRRVRVKQATASKRQPFEDSAPNGSARIPVPDGCGCVRA